MERLAAFVLIGVLAACREDPTSMPRTATGDLRLTSAEIDDGGTVPTAFTCDGADESPPLSWSGVPEGTVELVLLVEDPDAPAGLFTHWTVSGIDPATTGVGRGEVPAGAAEGMNDFGRPGYGGPCPPPGPAHRYVFSLHALPGPSGLEAGASPDEVRVAVGDATATAVLTARYGR